MTYFELKLAAMQKMFHDITSLTEDSVTKPYLDKMVYVSNCAVARACAVGAGMRKKLTISRVCVPNMIEKYKEYYKSCVVACDDVILNAKCGKAYSFNVCGKGNADIYVGNKLFKSISFESETGFKNYKGIIENPSNKDVKIVFLKNSPYIFSYPAVYDAFFERAEEVCENNEYIYYNMKKLAKDFCRFDSDSFIEEKSDRDTLSFKITDSETVAISADASGVWIIPYYAYPIVITKDTPDDEEINLPDEICLILPYYIASELYLEDDSGLAISWRNKFESSLSEYVFLKKQHTKRKYEIDNLAGGIYGEI